MSDDLKNALREWWEYDHGRLIENSLARIEELEAKLAKAVTERDEALNQLDSARHSVEVLKKRVAKLIGQDDE